MSCSRRTGTRAAMLPSLPRIPGRSRSRPSSFPTARRCCGPSTASRVRKGFHRALDSYSGFLEADRETTTGLAGFLKEKGLRQLYVCGLATDFCVAWTALDARATGFEASVIEDACRLGNAACSFAGVKQVVFALALMLGPAAAIAADPFTSLHPEEAYPDPEKP